MVRAGERLFLEFAHITNSEEARSWRQDQKMRKNSLPTSQISSSVALPPTRKREFVRRGLHLFSLLASPITLFLVCFPSSTIRKRTIVAKSKIKEEVGDCLCYLHASCVLQGCSPTESFLHMQLVKRKQDRMSWSSENMQTISCQKLNCKTEPFF